MANGIEALRRQYAQLTPFERANMKLHEATTAQREAVAEALAAPTLGDAYREAGATCALVLVTGYALAQSLKADRARVANLGLALRAQAKDEIFGLDNAYDAALERAAAFGEVAEGWMTALAKLEAETGGAFGAASKLLDETYADEMLDKSRHREHGTADDSGQLEMLRHAWCAMDGENG
ncbi:MAG: hypothetical protein AUJ49_02875 [Desulfovibrionaceae bacterium CG1_02_65_16]|nr:MAG: hypothetical protein AUJ49_02875 [Desulfovibrionaceae bacterium CG1_02_65_16]